MLRAFLARGFLVHREGGKHTIIRRQDVSIAVPRSRQLKRGTVRGMADEAGIDWNQIKREVS